MMRKGPMRVSRRVLPRALDNMADVLQCTVEQKMSLASLTRAYAGREEDLLAVIGAAACQKRLTEYLEKLATKYIESDWSRCGSHMRRMDPMLSLYFIELYKELGIQKKDGLYDA